MDEVYRGIKPNPYTPISLTPPPSPLPLFLNVLISLFFMMALLSRSPTHYCSGWSRIINFRIMPMQRFSTLNSFCGLDRNLYGNTRKKRDLRVFSPLNFLKTLAHEDGKYDLCWFTQQCTS